MLLGVLRCILQQQQATIVSQASSARARGTTIVRAPPLSPPYWHGMARPKTGAQAVIEVLVQEGIEICFANPGTTEMWFVGALAAAPGIRSILGLHETVCTGASDGYARMARKPALCVLHMGPGLVNGLSNLHNARRARSPVLVLVGDVATWHRRADPPLCMDIHALATTVSGSVATCTDGSNLLAQAGGAVRAANDCPCDPTRSRVSTLIVAHDLSWETDERVSSFPKTRVAASASLPDLEAFTRDCAAALRSCPEGKAALYLGGRALLEESDALVAAGRIAATVGATLLCENAFARFDRGEGLPTPSRLPYFPNEAHRALANFEMVVAVDVRLPVAQFGYKDGPSELLLLKEDFVWQIDAGPHTARALELLGECVGAQDIVPGKNCGGVFAKSARPSLPSPGKLTAAGVCSIVAHFQPPRAIVVDESITSGNSYWEASKGCPRFSHLMLTGGAIGCGPPMAVGAAVACPDRTVVNIQADGSAMYALQALWTQAKESLKVVTVIFSNNTYAILKLEVAKQGVPGLTASKLSKLTDLSKPEINWVALAEGMGVRAARASTVDEFTVCFKQALDCTGPMLIQAVL